jgi:iron complex outermembrane recepter protein
VKSESADKRLRLDADVFLMNWKDIQADYSIGQVSSGGVSFITGIANAASARSYGFETEVTALVVTGLTVGGGAGYDRAYYVSFPNAESGLGTTGDLSGATLPNAPKWTLHADSQYTRNFDAEQSGFLRLEWHYRGGIVSDQNSEFHTGFPWDVPSYNLWNLRAGYTHGDWTVTAFDENFLNKKYYTNAYEKAFVDGMFVEPGYRNIGIRLTVRTK